VLLPPAAAAASARASALFTSIKLSCNMIFYYRCQSLASHGPTKNILFPGCLGVYHGMSITTKNGFSAGMLYRYKNNILSPPQCILSAFHQELIEVGHPQRFISALNQCQEGELAFVYAQRLPLQILDSFCNSHQQGARSHTERVRAQ